MDGCSTCRQQEKIKEKKGHRSCCLCQWFCHFMGEPGLSAESWGVCLSVVSAIYHAQTAAIRGKVSTAALEIEAETLWQCTHQPFHPAGLQSPFGIIHACPRLSLTHTDMGLVACLLEEALTDTLPRVTREAGTVVTLQSSLAVTWKHKRAGLASLPGAHLAAPAAIQHQWNSRRTQRGWMRANARFVTQLAQHLQRHDAQSQARRS